VTVTAGAGAGGRASERETDRERLGKIVRRRRVLLPIQSMSDRRSASAEWPEGQDAGEDKEEEEIEREGAERPKACGALVGGHSTCNRRAQVARASALTNVGA